MDEFENTIILTLKLKIKKDEYINFNLRRYDDLFESLKEFVHLNKIKEDLLKPMVIKVFEILNKIFYLLNNKIGIYDQAYLNSLYKLWLKNNKEIEESININSNENIRRKEFDSMNKKEFKHIKSNSFQSLECYDSDNENNISINSI